MFYNPHHDEDTLIVNAGDSKEFPLHLHDTPFVMNIAIHGGLKYIRLLEKDYDTYLYVETFGNKTSDTLIIEVHPTGTLLPDADKVTYLGTAMVGRGTFVWHIFYLVRDAVGTPDEDDTTDDKPMYEDLYTIYKYPFDPNGSTTINIDSSHVKPLYAGMQYGRPTIWVQLKLERGEQTKAQAALNIIGSDEEFISDYISLNEVALEDDGTIRRVFCNVKYERQEGSEA